MLQRIIMSGRRGYASASIAIFGAMSPTPDTARRRLIDNAVVALQAAGVWAKIDGLWLFAAHGEQPGLVNWIDPDNVATNNGATFTADRGFEGDGSSAYIDTGNGAASATINSNSASVWLNVDGADGGNALGATATQMSIIPITSGELETRSSGAALGTVVADGLGFSGFGRTSGTGYTVQKNGAQTSKTQAATSFGAGQDYFLLAAAGPGGFTASRIAAAHIGGGLSPTELDALYDVLSTYLTAVGGA